MKADEVAGVNSPAREHGAEGSAVRERLTVYNGIYSELIPPCISVLHRGRHGRKLEELEIEFPVVRSERVGADKTAYYCPKGKRAVATPHWFYAFEVDERCRNCEHANGVIKTVFSRCAARIAKTARILKYGKPQPLSEAQDFFKASRLAKEASEYEAEIAAKVSRKLLERKEFRFEEVVRQ